MITWRAVPSCPGILANSLGQVKLPNKIVIYANGNSREYITKPTFGQTVTSGWPARHAFKQLSTRDFGTLKVHQLICEAFHGPKPFEEAVVIHLDANSLNNKFENLKWGTQKENLNHPSFIEYCKTRVGHNSPVNKGKLRDD